MKLVKNSKRTKRAFTLFEILIVIALMALLVAFVVSNMGAIFKGGQVSLAESTVKASFDAPLMAYKIAVGKFPTTEQGLKALVIAPEGAGTKWKGPYIKELPTDPWGNQYQYMCPGKFNKDSYDIWSFGPDGIVSDDDIGNWNMNAASAK